MLNYKLVFVSDKFAWTEVMRSRSWGQEMVKRGAEEMQIGVEERISGILCSVEIVRENRTEYEKAMEAFSVVLRHEFESMVRRLQDYKVEKEDGIIEFRLEEPTRALKNIVELVENWLLPFCQGIGGGAEWKRSLNLIETLHVDVKERVEDLSRNESRPGGCLSYEERFFVKGKVEAFRLIEDGVNKVKKNRRRRSKKFKVV